MPLTVKEGALLGAGAWMAAAATFFYRRKQTFAFKLAYFASWPLLGTAIIVTAMPDREWMEQVGVLLWVGWGGVGARAGRVNRHSTASVALGCTGGWVVVMLAPPQQPRRRHLRRSGSADMAARLREC